MTLSPPVRVKPVKWRLQINRTVAGLETATELTNWYLVRREIEQFWHVVKNGCRVEALQFGTVEGLALLLIVASLITQVMRLGQTNPELDASLPFERDEWIAAYVLSNKKLPAECRPHSTKWCVWRLCAGRFLGGKSHGESVAKTLWQGFQVVMLFAERVRFIRENHVRGVVYTGEFRRLNSPLLDASLHLLAFILFHLRRLDRDGCKKSFKSCCKLFLLFRKH